MTDAKVKPKCESCGQARVREAKERAAKVKPKLPDFAMSELIDKAQMAMVKPKLCPICNRPMTAYPKQKKWYCRFDDIVTTMREASE